MTSDAQIRKEAAQLHFSRLKKACGPHKPWSLDIQDTLTRFLDFMNKMKEEGITPLDLGISAEEIDALVKHARVAYSGSWKAEVLST